MACLCCLKERFVVGSDGVALVMVFLAVIGKRTGDVSDDGCVVLII